MERSFFGLAAGGDIASPSSNAAHRGVRIDRPQGERAPDVHLVRRYHVGATADIDGAPMAATFAKTLTHSRCIYTQTSCCSICPTA